MEKKNSSYSQIVKSSSITGGAQVINIGISTIRTKLIAILIGPEGVGLYSLYQSSIEMFSKAGGLGTHSSGIRQIAESDGKKDQAEILNTVGALKSIIVLAGVLGGGIIAIFASFLNEWIFESSEKSLYVAILGGVLLLTNLRLGCETVLRGLRHIKDLAKIQVFTGIATTLICVSLFSLYGSKSIAAAFGLASIANLAIAYYYFKKLNLPPQRQSLSSIILHAKRLLSLGMAFLWAGALMTLAALAIRMFITREMGIGANGIYQAAWALSGMMANFIFGAMGADFYPRLTSVAQDNPKMVVFAQEQTEVALLLALPGLLFTLAFSPWLMSIFYTSEFHQASDLLVWFVLGVYCRTISWPAGFIQLAKGKGRIFATSETISHIAHLSLIWFATKKFGLTGAAAAFTFSQAFYVLIALAIARKLCGYRLSWKIIKIAILSSMALGGNIAILAFAPNKNIALFGLLIPVVCSTLSLKQLIVRLGPDHKISRFCLTIPILNRIVAP